MYKINKNKITTILKKSWFGIENLSGINTLDVDFSEQRGGTATIAEVKIILWRIN